MLLVDSNADSTVLSARVLEMLRLEQLPPLRPVIDKGGDTGHVDVEAMIWFTRDGPDQVAFSGRFAAVAEPNALDMSVLGRDILRWFDLIVDRSSNIVCLVNQRHDYTISAC
jgi:hypothetical protein